MSKEDEVVEGGQLEETRDTLGGAGQARVWRRKKAPTTARSGQGAKTGNAGKARATEKAPTAKATKPAGRRRSVARTKQTDSHKRAAPRKPAGKADGAAGKEAEDKGASTSETQAPTRPPQDEVGPAVDTTVAEAESPTDEPAQAPYDPQGGESTSETEAPTRPPEAEVGPTVDTTVAEVGSPTDEPAQAPYDPQGGESTSETEAPTRPPQDEVGPTVDTTVAEVGSPTDEPAQAPYNPQGGEEYMSTEQLKYFKGKLVHWRDSLTEDCQKTIEAMRGQGPESNEEAERASRETEMTLELRTRDRYRKLTAKIDQALARIKDGSYGYCEQTGEPIGIGRLVARPIATLCVEEQERREKHQEQFWGQG